uniref:Uncharacterized protein n=1 Tax=Pipistrellus kuhlii TaxID=59472 RepID=A0A7J7VV73_PIPKU|nr:hypothetical protein mPipKuh1_008262 [Pipistrellus kuhlii]
MKKRGLYSACLQLTSYYPGHCPLICRQSCTSTACFLPHLFSSSPPSSRPPPPPRQLLPSSLMPWPYARVGLLEKVLSPQPPGVLEPRESLGEAATRVEEWSRRPRGTETRGDSLEGPGDTPFCHLGWVLPSVSFWERQTCKQIECSPSQDNPGYPREQCA